MSDDIGRIDNVIDLKKREKRRVSPNLVIPTELIKSKAWFGLGSKCSISAQVYLIFLSKRQMVKTGKKGHEKWQCTNIQEIVFTYSEAQEKYGITQPRFMRAIDDLIDKGFIDIAKSASGLFKEVTLYGLSERWQKYGTPQFEDTPRLKRNHTIGFCKPKKKTQIQQEQDL